MFSTVLLEDLGIRKEECRRHQARGLGSDAGVYFASVVLRCENLGDFNVYAGFSDSTDRDTLMLGHIDFLEHFTAGFDYQTDRFLLIRGSVGLSHDL
jgi:hypothetical protein